MLPNKKPVSSYSFGMYTKRRVHKEDNVIQAREVGMNEISN